MRTNNKGMTLVEIIVSLAIIAIIFIVFLNVFGSSMVGIINAGNKSRAGFMAQDTLENAIATNPGTGTDTVSVELFDSAVPGTTGTGTVKSATGRNISVTGGYGTSSSTITTFVAND